MHCVIPSSALRISFSFPPCHAFMNIFAPKKRKRMDAAICVHLHGMRVGRRWPIAAERMDMTTREPNAPAKTSSRGWRIARIAAMQKVLSPISENIIIAKDCSTVSGVLSPVHWSAPWLQKSAQCGWNKWKGLPLDTLGVYLSCSPFNNVCTYGPGNSHECTWHQLE